MQNNFKTSGNLISENIPMTKEFLDFCLQQNVKVSLKTGDFSTKGFERNRNLKYNETLIKQIHRLYLSGNCCLEKFFEIFNVPRGSYFTKEIFPKMNLQILEMRDYKNLYKSELQEIQKRARSRYEVTNLERYGTTIPLRNTKIKEKSKQTSLQRYGVDNPSKSQEIKDKIKRTTRQKYGVLHPLQSQEIKEKLKQTNLERYNVEHNWNNGILREKLKQKWIELYGVDNPIKSAEIREKIKKTNLERYNVEQPFQSQEIQSKVCETFLQRYGVDNPLKSAEIQFEINNGKFSMEFLEERSRKLSEIKENFEKFDELEILGFLRENYSQPWRSHLEIEFGLRKQYKSSLETKVCSFLDSLEIDYVCNKRTILDSGLELDIFIPEHKIAIECNGIFWHSSKFKDRNYHQNKKLEAKSKGISLLQFTEYEIVERFDVVKSIILHRLGFTTVKIPARSCKIIQVESDQAKEFFNLNHLSGFDESSEVFFGLEFQSEIVQVFGFYGSSCIQFCSKIGTVVQGGISKILSILEVDKIKFSVDANVFDADSAKVFQIVPKLSEPTEKFQGYFDCGKFEFEVV